MQKARVHLKKKPLPRFARAGKRNTEEVKNQTGC